MTVGEGRSGVENELKHATAGRGHRDLSPVTRQTSLRSSRSWSSTSRGIDRRRSSPRVRRCRAGRWSARTGPACASLDRAEYEV